jgi:drug efflux transport system permease protein
VFERLKYMLIKEFLQILRDPRMRAVIVAVPIAQVIIFGYAVTTDVRDIRTAIYDQDNTSQSRDLLDRFSGSGYFKVVRRLQSEEGVRNVLDRGEAKAVFRIHRGFGDAIAAGRAARLQILLDGTDSNTASLVLKYAAGITTSYNEDLLAKTMEKRSGQTPGPTPIVLAERAWFNPNLDSRNYFLPGVIALLVMVVSLLLSSMAIVREKEIGTIEQIMVTPIGRLEFILGKTIPFALIGFLDVVLIALLAVLWFGVPIEGNPLLLLAATGLYLLSTLGVGLLISTISRTQQQAMMTAFFFMQPALLLSGFLYPIANMPAIVRWLTYLNPLRYFLVIIRGIFLKGVGIAVLWPQMAALAVLGTALLFLAAGRFKKTLA